MRFLVFLLAAALAGLAGCAGKAGNAAPFSPETDRVEENGTYSRQVSPYGQENGYLAPPAEAEEEPAFDAETADRLEQLAESVQGVNGATCVVLGNMAIVGIDVDGDLDRGRVGSVKYAVAEALAKDPAGMRALVTADLDLKNRIRNLRDRAKEGRPLRGLAEQFAELVGRMMPQLPRDTAPEAEPQGHPDDRKSLEREQRSGQTAQPSAGQNGVRQHRQPGRKP